MDCSGMISIPRAPKAGGLPDAVLEGQRPQEVLVLVGVETDAPLDAVTRHRGRRRAAGERVPGGRVEEVQRRRRQGELRAGALADGGRPGQAGVEHRALAEGAQFVHRGGVDVLGDLERDVGDHRLGVDPQVDQLLRRHVLDELRRRRPGAATTGRRWRGRAGSPGAGPGRPGRRPRRATGTVQAPAGSGSRWEPTTELGPARRTVA